MQRCIHLFENLSFARWPVRKEAGLYFCTHFIGFQSVLMWVYTVNFQSMEKKTSTALAAAVNLLILWQPSPEPLRGSDPGPCVEGSFPGAALHFCLCLTLVFVTTSYWILLQLYIKFVTVFIHYFYFWVSISFDWQHIRTCSEFWRFSGLPPLVTNPPNGR